MECVRAEEPEFYQEQLVPAMATMPDKHAHCPQVGVDNEKAAPALAATL